MGKASKRRGDQYRVGEVSKAVLCVVAGAGLIASIAVLPGLAMAMAPFTKKKRTYKKQTVEKSINTLVRKGLLKKKINKNGEIVLEMTRKGKWEAGIRGYLNKERSKKNPKWDGVWRVIIFDVPENKRSIRDELRKATSLYGFHQLQKSVWVYPYPCSEFVRLVKSHLGISHDVLYLTSNYIEDDSQLRKEFNLQ